MQIAYLITAYIDPSHLKRLINSLDYNKNEDNTEFFIHIDKKNNIFDFSSIINKPNVHFIKTRYKISWGDFSQVQSIVALIKESLKKQYKFDRFVCISGTDYPLYSNKRIFEEFKFNRYKEYLIGYNITKGNSNKQKEKLKKIWFMKFNFTRRLSRILPMRKRNYTVINNKIVDVYFGSDYWALSREAMIYVLQTYQENKILVNYLRYCYVPSEMFIQTIIFNSKYKKNTISVQDKDYNGLSTLTPLHYIEYNEKIEVFQETDFELLINSDKMFFRKALTGKSDKLLELIDKYREISNG